MSDDKSMVTLIEEKIADKLQIATIDDVSTHVVQGIEYVMLDWDEFEQYPRIVIYCDEDIIEEQQISPNGLENRRYTANVFLLCYNDDYEELILQRDVVLRRIKECLRGDKRLGNLVDNNTNESVWNSYISRIRYSKSGYQYSYNALAWVELIIQTSMI